MYITNCEKKPDNRVDRFIFFFFLRFSTMKFLANIPLPIEYTRDFPAYDASIVVDDNK